MADFIGCLESTSFRVKDRESWLADPVVQKLKETAERDGFFEEDDGGYWAFGWYGQYPSPVLSAFNEKGEEEEYDILDAIQRHIRPGDACQVSVSGNENLRYIGGPVWFVTSRGTATFDATTEWGSILTEESLRGLAERFHREVDALTG